MAHDVVAVRGVCVKPGVHLQPGQRATLDAATFRFLQGIGAVRLAPAELEPTPQPAAPAKATRQEK